MAPVASLHAPEVACAVVKDPVRKVIAPQVVARHALQSMRGLEQAGMQRVSCTEHDRSGFVMLAANMTLNGDSSSSMYWWAYSPGGTTGAMNNSNTSLTQCQQRGTPGREEDEASNSTRRAMAMEQAARSR